jgi:hypothetical protein
MNWMWFLLVISTLLGGVLTLSALSIWIDLQRALHIERRAA